MATRNLVACDPSSQVRKHRGSRRQVSVAGVENQAHANLMIVMSGAVISLASALPVHAAEIEIPARSMQPRNQRCRILQRSFSIAEVIRFARLCVLIEPNPARRSVYQDLGRDFRIFVNAVRRASLLNPPNLINAAELNGL